MPSLVSYLLWNLVLFLWLLFLYFWIILANRENIKLKNLVVLLFVVWFINSICYLSAKKNKMHNFPIFALLYQLKYMCIFSLVLKDHIIGRKYYFQFLHFAHVFLLLGTYSFHCAKVIGMWARNAHKLLLVEKSQIAIL